MEGEIHCSSREEARDINITIRNEEIEFDGHRERFESAELVEIIRSLKMEVQSCREDNERLIRAQEKKNKLNDKLVQSLNQLRKERKRESGSRHQNENISHPRRESYKIHMHSRSASRDIKHHYSVSAPRK